MSHSYHYHCNSTEEILMGLQKQQTRCLKDCSDSLQQPLPVKHKINLIRNYDLFVSQVSLLARVE